MKNNRGFTLIELIAAITILSIIMLIAIPNILSVSIKSKNRTYVNDANKLVILAKYLFESDANIDKPTGTKCLVLTLNDLDRTELQKGPENGEYDLNKCYVVIKYESSKYVYYVQTQEKYDTNKYKGIPLTKYNDLISSEDKNKFVFQDNGTSNKWKNATTVTNCTAYYDSNNVNKVLN